MIVEKKLRICSICGTEHDSPYEDVCYECYQDNLKQQIAKLIIAVVRRKAL